MVVVFLDVFFTGDGKIDGKSENPSIFPTKCSCMLVVYFIFLPFFSFILECLWFISDFGTLVHLQRTRITLSQSLPSSRARLTIVLNVCPRQQPPRCAQSAFSELRGEFCIPHEARRRFAGCTRDSDADDQRTRRMTQWFEQFHSNCVCLPNSAKNPGVEG